MLSIEKLFSSLNEAAHNTFASIIEAVRTLFEGDPETRRKVAFSVAIIALSAKMAKADGIVTEDEVNAFQDIFEIPPEEAGNVARLYNLAKQDVSGYDAYAYKLANLCGTAPQNCQILQDVLDGLYHIAKADGVIHEHEAAVLQHIALIFGIDDSHYEQIMARHVASGDDPDPYGVLGVQPSTPFAQIKARYRQLALESHPDQLRARGLPDEFMAIANERMAKFNSAFAAIEKIKAQS